jgi:DNA-binding NtrC family response regulator
MKNKNILIIDDDQDLLDSLKVILESHGFNVNTASNKIDGLELFSEQKPDLMILDIMMENELEGYSMLHDFRKDDSIIDIPIIMYSGMAQQIGVNFRSAVENEKMFPNVSFFDKQDDVNKLINHVKKALTIESGM